MKGILTFLLNVSGLKTMPRTGWVVRGVKNPETIAEHSFRIAWLAWVLGAYAGLRVHRAIQIALLHDICEVYSGDQPFWYGILANPRDPKQRAPYLTRWIRLAQRQKARIRKEKFLHEQNALEKLARVLSPGVRKGILAHWLEYEEGSSREGKFAKQVDIIEPLLQAIEYFGTAEGTPVDAWWEMAEELVDDPLLLKFLKTIERHLYRGEKTRLDGALEFLVAVGKLKRMPRLGWIKRGVRNPDSLANHSFMVALMSWLMARAGGRRLNLERALKMALAHHLFAITLPQRSAYDAALKNAKTADERRLVFNGWLRSSLKEKRGTFRQASKEETRAVRQLTAALDTGLRTEIRTLWREMRHNQSAEARFVNQIGLLELLLQALRYWAEDKKFPIAAWWERAYEHIDDPFLLEFLEALKNRFYTKP